MAKPIYEEARGHRPR